MLRLDGWRVNRKRVYRLCKQKSPKVPSKQHKKRRLGSGEHGIVRRRAEHKDHVWCVALEARRSMTARGVAEALIGLFTTRGVPRHIRSGNRPEFIAQTIRRLVMLTSVEHLYIAPSSPT